MYFTGGAGLNLGTTYSPNSESVCFIDSSEANLKHRKIAPERMYIIPNTDGAGGDQSFMMPHARKHAPLILEQFEPGQQNIIVTSGGGGTGPTVAASLLDNMLKNGENVIVMVVGGYDATKRVRNTTNILKNLELLSLKHQQPVVVSYISNSGGEAAADEEALFTLSALDALTDQENERLDTKDLENFLHFNRVCAVQPQLCTLHIRETRADAAKVLEPIMVIALLNDISLDVPYGSPFERKVGITKRTDKLPGNQMHFIINSVGVTDIFEDLEQTLTKLNTVQSGFRQRRSSFVVQDLGEGDDLFVS